MLPHNTINRITLLDKPMQLVVRRLGLNKPAPDCLLVNNYMEEVRLSHFKNKIKVINSLVSLDAPVCELQLRKFNEAAARFSSDVVFLAVSKDLPFAQQRMCINQKIYNSQVLSDYKYSSFGVNYGLLIKELNLLARAAIILDGNNFLRYIQVGGELAKQLDYADALGNLDSIIRAGSLSDSDKLAKKSALSKGGESLLLLDDVKDHLPCLPGWQLIDNRMIAKEIKFNDFKGAKYFLALLFAIIDEHDYSPIFTLDYNKLKITLTNNVVGGLTDNDFIMAKIIDELEVND